MEVALNSSSAMGQCLSSAQLELVLKEFFMCLLHIEPAISKNLISVHWGDELHGRYLHRGRGAPFEAAISALGNDDLKTKWFFVTRNYFRLGGNSVGFTADINGRAKTVTHTGEVFSEAVNSIEKWLSFCGGDFEGTDVALHGGPSKENAAYLADFVAWFPIYVGSPKHKAEEYSRKGWVVSRMDLNAAEAQVALMGAVLAPVGKSRFAKYGGRYYRFLPSGGHTVRREYHGFCADPKSIPSSVMELIE